MWSWLALLTRLVVGGVWLSAGSLKLGDPAGSVRAVQAYRLLPSGVEVFVGLALPIVEVALGVLLIGGLFARPAAALSAVMLMVFIGAIWSVSARGISIDCGCFGGGGQVGAGDTSYAWESARDAALLVASASVVWRPSGRWSLDSWLDSWLDSRLAKGSK